MAACQRMIAGWRGGVATVGLLSLWLTGQAAEGVLDEITVTAQKREQSIQDVGISISAFSGALVGCKQTKPRAVGQR